MPANRKGRRRFSLSVGPGECYHRIRRDDNKFVTMQRSLRAALAQRSLRGGTENKIWLIRRDFNVGSSGPDLHGYTHSCSAAELCAGLGADRLADHPAKHNE